MAQQIFKVLQLIFLSVFFVGTTFAAEYYVSPTGSATWPTCTTVDNPCRASNTSKAFLGASAGDTVYFLDGVYSGIQQPNESDYTVPAWVPNISGTEGNPVTYKALNSRGAHLIGLKKTRMEVPIFGSGDGSRLSWVVFDGFKISAVDESGNPVMAKFNLYTADHIVVNDCEIVGATHSTGGANNYEGVRIESSNYVTVSNCYIHGWKESSYNHNTSAIKTYNAYYGKIANNLFTDNYTNIYLKGAGNGYFSIYNNFIDGGQNGLIYTMNSGDHNGHTIYNNIFSEQTLNVIGDDGATSYTANDLTIYNNTFYHTNSTISILSTTCDSGHSATIYNNIFVNSGYDIVTRPGYSSSPKYSDHNIFYPSLGVELSRYSSARYYTTLSSWQSSGELAAAVDVGCGTSKNPGCGSLVVNPMFANVSGSMSRISDFAVSNTLGRNGRLIGADVSLFGTDISVGGTLKPEPSPLLKIVTQ